MRKIIVTEFLSLDGVMEEPAWSLPYWNDAIAKFKQEELFASGAHLLGRVTYQGFAAAWPGRKDKQGFADRMNQQPKFVVSNTLEKSLWQGTTIIKGDVVAGVNQLKETDCGDLLVAGSATLVQTLVKYNQVDEFHFLVYPLLLGAGKRLFEGGIGDHGLNLIESRPMGSGVILLIYGPGQMMNKGPVNYSEMFSRRLGSEIYSHG